MLVSLQGESLGPISGFSIDAGSRLNLLTGDNGLGKTYLLDLIWRIQSYQLTQGVAWAPPGTKPKVVSVQDHHHIGSRWTTSFVYSPQQQGWKVEHSNFAEVDERSPSPSPVVYVRSEGDFAVFDSARSQNGNAKLGEGLYEFSSSELWDGLRSPEGAPITTGLTTDWVTWQLSPNQDLFQRLTDVLTKLSDGREPLCPSQPSRIFGDPRLQPSLRMPYGDLPLKFASAGVKRIVGLAYLLLWTWDEHLLACQQTERIPSTTLTVLIDELETHLHPRWQRLILPSLLTAIERLTGSGLGQIFASTHSPLVTASLEPKFNPDTDRLFHLRADDSRTATVENLAWVVRGEADNWLTSAAFGLEQPRSLPAEEAILEAMAAMRNPKIEPTQMKAIHEKLRQVLGDLDPYWPRWLFFAEQKGIQL